MFYLMDCWFVVFVGYLRQMYLMDQVQGWFLCSLQIHLLSLSFLLLNHLLQCQEPASKLTSAKEKVSKEKVSKENVIQGKSLQGKSLKGKKVSKGKILQGKSLQEPVLPQLDPLVRVADAGILDQGPKHHEEADKEVDVDGLHVGDLGQGGVDRVDQGGHGEDGGDPQSNLQIRNIC